MGLGRLKQPKKRGEQLRLLPAAEMPKGARPPEKDLVVRLRSALAKMGYLTWSGRVAAFRAIETRRREDLLLSLTDEEFARLPQLTPEDRATAMEAARNPFEAPVSAPDFAKGFLPFIPALGIGTPDILGIFPGGSGRFFGIECKRADGDKERASQRKWREIAEAWGVFCALARTVEEGIGAVEAERIAMASRRGK